MSKSYFRNIGEIDEAHELPFALTDVNSMYPTFTRTLPESKPAPTTYLTTYNPYLSTDWKEEVRRRVYGEFGIPEHMFAKLSDVSAEKQFKKILNDIYGKPKTSLEKIGRSLTAASMAAEACKSDLEIHSPSKALYEVGKLSAKGLNEGIRKAHQDAFDAVRYSLDEYVKFAEEKKKEKENMNIIVHRYYGKRAEEAYRYLKRKFADSQYSKPMTYDDVRMIIRGDGVIIHVRFGDVDHMAGLKPDYWYADTGFGKEFLRTRGGEELPEIYYAYKTALDYLIEKEKKNMNKLVNDLNARNGVAVIEVNGNHYRAKVHTVTTKPDELTAIEAYVYHEPENWLRTGRQPAVRPSSPTLPSIKKVIFNDPATIVIWKDGSKTIVKAQDEAFDPEKGLAIAISKKALGNNGRYFNEFKKWLPEEKKEEPKQEEKTKPVVNPEGGYCSECEHGLENASDEDGPCFRCIGDPAKPNFKLREAR